MFRDLVQIFAFKAAIGRFNKFAVFAAYFDESATGTPRGGTVAVAAALATLQDWQSFDSAWRPVVGASDFHALRNDAEQRRLSAALPPVMRATGVYSVCVVFERADYYAVTTQVDRSVFGNDHGFAWMAGASIVSGALQANGEYAGYYIDQGGLGSKKAMQYLAGAYRDDESREEWRIADFGPADRRVHFPLHPADLVAHEVATVGASSPVISYLGDDVNVVALDREKVASITVSLAALWASIKKQRDRERVLRRRLQREGS